MKYILLIVTISLSLAGCQSVTTKSTDAVVTEVAADIKQISPADASLEVAKAYSQFIDVRTPGEYAGGHADRAVNIPLDTLLANIDRLEKNEPVYLICQTGNRSKSAALMLKKAGFDNVLNLAGGTTAWQAADLPMETRSPHEAPKAN